MRAEQKALLVYGGIDFQSEFDTAEEVLEFVKQHPGREYTIHLRDGQPLRSTEVEKILADWQKR